MATFIPQAGESWTITEWRNWGRHKQATNVYVFISLCAWPGVMWQRSQCPSLWLLCSDGLSPGTRAKGSLCSPKLLYAEVFVTATDMKLEHNRNRSAAVPERAKTTLSPTYFPFGHRLSIRPSCSQWQQELQFQHFCVLCTSLTEGTGWRGRWHWNWWTVTPQLRAGAMRHSQKWSSNQRMGQPCSLDSKKPAELRTD